MRFCRRLLALVFLLALTVPFLDCTGLLTPYLAPLAKSQFLPALLSLRTFTWCALGIVLGILLLTFVFGRLYCSVICPLGILQDIIARLTHLLPKRVYTFAEAHTKTRGFFLALACLGGFLGLNFAFLAPYGLYGRVVATFLTPLARLGNNALAPWCQAHGSYVIRCVEVTVPALATIIGAGLLLVVVVICATAKGRLWCNTVCPVGTLLGFISRHARIKPTINADTCIKCGACVRVCKAQCVNLTNTQIDTSRCVACFNCSAACKKGALTWK